jgi:1-deoxy-D-xylulose-5-phosphate reductoisomerase
LNLAEIGQLNFCEPDHTRFPCLQLGYEALRIGGSMPAVLNAANEVAVQAFLDRHLGFLGIAETIRRTMAAHDPTDILSVEDALQADAWARKQAAQMVDVLASASSMVH